MSGLGQRSSQMDYEMALCYVDEILVIASEPMKTMDGIRAVFNLKGDKTKKLDIYLGASLSELETADGTKCSMISSEKCVKLLGIILCGLQLFHASSHSPSAFRVWHLHISPSRSF